MEATNIKWDTDGNAEVLATLPTNVAIPSNISEDEVSDYLSDITGFCHFGYELSK